MYPNNSNQDDQYMKSPPPPPRSAPPAAVNYNDYPHHPPVTGIPVPVQNYAGIPVPAQPLAQFDTATHPGYWSSGLCDCGSDVPNCFITIFCPCITFGQISEIVDKGSTPCGVSAALYALLAYFTGCACIYSCFYRSRLRSQYMLPESPCADFLVHCCCEPCALCQEYRELKHRGFDMSIGWHGNMERQNREVTMAPIAQQRMDR